jgi:hypothetical protein
MPEQIIELTYIVDDIINSEYVVKLDKQIPDPINFQTNKLSYSNARLFFDYNEVGKIYYFSNSIQQLFPITINKYLENVVIELYPSPCFETGTFLIGQLFHGINSNIFDKNKTYSFKSISSGGSFIDKEINVSIKTDESQIRKVKIIINN